MRAQSSEQFDPSHAWRIAEGFLAQHAVSPDGLPAAPGVVSLLMVGVWAGCRFALLDRGLAAGIAEAGNERRGLVYEALRLAFAVEFEAPLGELVRDVLRARGFTNAGEFVPPLAEPPPGPLSAPEVVADAEQLLRGPERPDPDGEGDR